jgi:hypothetical protein
VTNKNIDDFKDLLFTKKALAHLAIVRKNNIPHVSPVWFDLSEQDLKNMIININSAKGRVKSNNMVVGSKVSLSIVDPDNLYRYLGLNGEIKELIFGEEAIRHIDNLSLKYRGKDKYENLKPSEERVKYIIKIENIF